MTQTSSDAVTDRPEFIANPAKSERMLCAQVKFNSSKTMVMPKQGASRLLRFGPSGDTPLHFGSLPLCRKAELSGSPTGKLSSGSYNGSRRHCCSSTLKSSGRADARFQSVDLISVDCDNSIRQVVL